MTRIVYEIVNIFILKISDERCEEKQFPKNFSSPLEKVDLQMSRYAE